MKLIKTIACYIILLATWAFCIWFGYEAGLIAHKYTEPFTPKKKLVIEQLIDIQEQVGCKRIDGEIGPETTRLVNAQCIKDANEHYNKLAAKFMTTSGAPRKESNGNKESQIKADGS